MDRSSSLNKCSTVRETVKREKCDFLPQPISYIDNDETNKTNFGMPTSIMIYREFL